MVLWGALHSVSCKLSFNPYTSVSNKVQRLLHNYHPNDHPGIIKQRNRLNMYVAKITTSTIKSNRSPQSVQYQQRTGPLLKPTPASSAPASLCSTNTSKPSQVSSGASPKIPPPSDEATHPARASSTPAVSNSPRSLPKQTQIVSTSLPRQTRTRARYLAPGDNGVLLIVRWRAEVML